MNQAGTLFKHTQKLKEGFYLTSIKDEMFNFGDLEALWTGWWGVVVPWASVFTWMDTVVFGPELIAE